MENKNDKIILKLKAEIAEEKKSLKKIKNFTPITNCSLDMDGVRHNLHVVQQPMIVTLLVKLNALRLSAEDLDLLADYTIGGYQLEDWITDLKGRLLVVGAKDRETKLKTMEDKLHQLLSSDKKVELEIDSILKDFKGNEE